MSGQKESISVGESVQEAIELTNQGFYERAYLPTANAIAGTIAKVTGGDGSSELAIQKFIKENFQLVTFMGMPRALPLPLNIPFQIKRIMPQFNSLHGAEEIVSLTITDTLKFLGLPETFAVGSGGTFEVHSGRVWLPSGLVCGLLGSVIFQPANKGETIGDECWISISDFKMFVSELFGRRDLAERIMKFYQG
jgi:hypothetical protein